MELFDICDENGRPTGRTIERNIAHRDGIAHRTSHVWIVRTENERAQILLQKRQKNKDSFPGMYDTSSAGHIPAGCEPLESALRELYEELGIRAEGDDLHFAGSFHADYALPFHGTIFHDNEYVSVFVCDLPVRIEDIRIQEDEIEEVQWFDLEEVYQECSDGIRTRFCVPVEGLNILIRDLEQRKKIQQWGLRKSLKIK